jgi:hypothetical protein
MRELCKSRTDLGSRAGGKDFDVNSKTRCAGLKVKDSGMKKDSVSKDSMSKDSMSKDSMSKEKMSK